MFWKKDKEASQGAKGNAAVSFTPRRAASDIRSNVEIDQSISPDESAPVDALGKPVDKVFGKAININTVEDFSALPLPFEALIDNVQLGESLSFNVRPVLFGGPRGSGAARAAVLVNESYANSDEVAELLAILSDTKKWGAAWQMWSHASRIVMPDHLLLALGRGEINKDGLSNKRKIVTDQKKHSFFVAFKDIVEWGVRENASDLHFNLDFQKDYSQVMVHINGRYVAPARFRIATRTLLQILNVAWMSGSGGNGAYFDTRIEQQCRINLDIDGREIMLRWASVSAEYPGPSVTMRIVKLSTEGQIPTLDSLSYLPDQVDTFYRAMNAEKGAILLVGVVGSGKSVTLAALMASLPKHRKKMGAEDPVEIIIPGMIQKSINRPLEGDTGKEFEAFAKTIKRSAVNDVLLGEIRDHSTGAFFVDGVLMGTSFYSTTHAPSALGAYDKLASDMVGVSRHFLATPGNIKLIAYQSLLPKLCDCAIPVENISKPGHVDYTKNGADYISRIEQLYRIDTGKVKIRNAMGCSKCRHESISELNGFSGRTLAAEMIEPDETLLTLVKQGDSIGMHRYIYQSGTATAFDDPMMTGKTAMDCAVYKMSQGIVDPREIEPRFHSFEREAILRRPARSLSKSVVAASPENPEVKANDNIQ